MSPILIIILTLFAYMTFWYLVSLIIRRGDIADIAWGPGFILLSWTAFFLLSPSTPALIINTLVTIWGLRLATHIYLRNKDKPEDSRYAGWRRDWGAWYPLRSYLQIFLLQGLFLFFIAIPLVYANLISVNFSPFYLLGFIIWLVGFAFETLADYQLSQFKSNPNNKGKIMMTGVWSLSRHPNYFGEVSLWWGIYIMILPLGWWTLIGPLTITLLILGVSGIPMLELRYKSDQEYAKYQARVSSFFPLPPKKSLVK